MTNGSCFFGFFYMNVFAKLCNNHQYLTFKWQQKWYQIFFPLQFIATISFKTQGHFLAKTMSRILPPGWCWDKNNIPDLSEPPPKNAKQSYSIRHYIFCRPWSNKSRKATVRPLRLTFRMSSKQVTSGLRPPCTQRNCWLRRAARGKQSNASMQASYTRSEYFILPAGSPNKRHFIIKWLFQAAAVLHTGRSTFQGPNPIMLVTFYIIYTLYLNYIISGEKKMIRPQ